MSLTFSAQRDVWGGPTDKTVATVCANVAKQILVHCRQAPGGHIEVRYNPNDHPRTLYRTSPSDPYVITLNAHGTDWCKYAYQFAHEYCHVLTDHDRLRKKPNQWFHEAICELASVFAIDQMADTWLASPPYPDWADYAASLRKYADGLKAFKEWQLPLGMRLSEWLAQNEPALRANSFDRDLNGVVAMTLLPLFQANPKAGWGAIQFMPNTNATFAKFLALWHDACPGEYQAIVRQIGGLFGVAIGDNS